MPGGPRGPEAAYGLPLGPARRRKAARDQAAREVAQALSAVNLFLEQALKGVEPSPELRRILAMPRRDPEAIGQAIAPVLTERLRLRWPERPPPDIPHALRWYQALALAEIHDFRGALVPLPVGAGKSLITILAPTVLRSQRACLLLPAKLREKAYREIEAYRQWWRVQPLIQVLSYETLSVRPDELLRLGPDALICDEAYNLKNPRSGRKKRVWRYMRMYPDTPFIPLTGTVQKKGFLDWWHIQRGALQPEIAVLPHSWPEVVQWNQALAPNLTQRRPVGALSLLCGQQGGDHEGVRKAYGERFRMTPGVITCPGGSCDASIQFTLEHMRHREIDTYMTEMRRTWETPDGTPFNEGSDLWRHARELANGYIYRWKVPGPKRWMEARREANAFLREILRHSRTLDTELQVWRAYPDEPALVRWREIKPTFTPETEPVWFTYDVIDAAVERARAQKALLWVEHTAVGRKISERHGIPYFARLGRDPQHGSIMDWPGGPCVVSTTAVGEGFNLQDRWHRNVILNITPGCKEYEQTMGRTHRQGQRSDLVEYTQLVLVQEQIAGFEKALAQARAAEQTDSQAKKLTVADVVRT